MKLYIYLICCLVGNYATGGHCQNLVKSKEEVALPNGLVIKFDNVPIQGDALIGLPNERTVEINDPNIQKGQQPYHLFSTDDNEGSPLEENLKLDPNSLYRDILYGSLDWGSNPLLSKFTNSLPLNGSFVLKPRITNYNNIGITSGLRDSSTFVKLAIGTKGNKRLTEPFKQIIQRPSAYEINEVFSLTKPNNKRQQPEHFQLNQDTLVDSDSMKNINNLLSSAMYAPSLLPMQVVILKPIYTTHLLKNFYNLEDKEPLLSPEHFIGNSKPFDIEHNILFTSQDLRRDSKLSKRNENRFLPSRTVIIQPVVKLIPEISVNNFVPLLG